MENTPMQKLDTMGNVVNKQSNVPKYGGGQIINVTYGHNGSGKLYSYYGTNKRTGDIVTPEVTNPKSGKTYRTLAVVRSTHNIANGGNTVNYLQGKTPNANGEYKDKPTNLKYIGKTDQKSLPGYYPGWEKDAQAAYDLRMEVQKRDDIDEMQKKNLFGEIRKLRNR